LPPEGSLLVSFVEEIIYIDLFCYFVVWFWIWLGSDSCLNFTIGNLKEGCGCLVTATVKGGSTKVFCWHRYLLPSRS